MQICARSHKIEKDRGVFEKELLKSYVLI